MNILIAVTQLTKENGGVSTHVVELCKQLENLGHQVVVVSNGGEYALQLDCIHYNIKFDNIQKHPLEMLKAFREIKRIVKQHKIEIIHSHGQSIILFAQLIKWRYGIPYVWTNHIDAIAQPKLFQLLYKCFKFPIISVSTDLKNYLVQNFSVNEKDLTVINNGINVENYLPLDEMESKKYRKLFHIKPEEFVITLMGRMAKVKGHQLLLEAINTLQEKYTDIQFNILFAGAIDKEKEKLYWEERKAYAIAHNIKLNYIGFQNPRHVLGVSNLLVLPSLYEGFPIVCIEAFMMKCPVVRSDTPGSSDTKEVSLIHKKENVKDLMEKIEMVLTNKDMVREMIEHAYNKAVTEYSSTEMTKQTLNMYDTVLRREKK